MNEPEQITQDLSVPEQITQDLSVLLQRITQDLSVLLQRMKDMENKIVSCKHCGSYGKHLEQELAEHHKQGMSICCGGSMLPAETTHTEG